MRSLLRFVAWVTLIFGAVFGPISVIVFAFAQFLHSGAPYGIGPFVIDHAMRGILGVAQTIAVGGGLLVILDIDRRLAAPVLAARE